MTKDIKKEVVTSKEKGMAVRNRGGVAAAKGGGGVSNGMNNTNGVSKTKKSSLSSSTKKKKKSQEFLPNLVVTVMQVILVVGAIVGFVLVFPRVDHNALHNHGQNDTSSSSSSSLSSLTTTNGNNNNLRVRDTTRTTDDKDTGSILSKIIPAFNEIIKQSEKKQSRPSRFPRYDTPEFAQQCNWTIPSPDTPDPKCGYLTRPPTRAHEGISDWASNLVTSYIMARQLGCKVYVDYGLNVDIHKVIIPYPNIHPLHNWSTPSSITCEQGCDNQIRKLFGWNASTMGRFHQVNGPKYRYSMGGLANKPLYKGDFDHLKTELPGFDLQIGMACVLGNIFGNFAPTAAEFEPKLFTDLLPAVQDEEALVITVYVRTNRADNMAIDEAHNQSIRAEKELKPGDFLPGHASIARCIEEQYLTGVKEPDLGTLSRVVWMVISDSIATKQHADEVYTSEDLNSQIPLEKQKWKNKVIPRQILYTSARGVHTRPERNPGTRDFAEGFIDWYLIGESDAVITERISSFGPTGAMRTNRPLFRTTQMGNCSYSVPVLLEKDAKDKK